MPPTTSRRPYAIEVRLNMSKQAAMASIAWVHFPQGVRTVSRMRLQRVHLGLDDLRGLTDAEQVLQLLDALSQSLGDQERARVAGAPLGGPRGEERQPHEYPTLNLDFTL